MIALDKLRTLGLSIILAWGWKRAAIACVLQHPTESVLHHPPVAAFIQTQTTAHRHDPQHDNAKD